MSVNARDRQIQDWYQKIKLGEIKLPRFQRHEAWESNRITSLLTTIVHNLPLGITLILEVDQEKFISRYIVTAEPNSDSNRVTEHLLDGQQRLTAIWRATHNNYEDEKYFLFVNEYCELWDKENDEDLINGTKVISKSRWIDKKGRTRPLWADIPDECLKRGCIPFELFRPEDIVTDVNKWVDKALEDRKPDPGSVEDYAIEYERYSEEKRKLTDRINKVRESLKHYNLPYLSLPSTTKKSTALQVFINMNTNSKPLSQYDIVVAEVEEAVGKSLHDLQDQLEFDIPNVEKFEDLSKLILHTGAVLQKKLPNKRGVWDMDKEVFIQNWSDLEYGLEGLVKFLYNHKIFNNDLLPTNAILAIIASLYSTCRTKDVDKKGYLDILLKKYLWSSFFTDRYENSAASRAFVDFNSIHGLFHESINANTNNTFTEQDVPVFNRELFPLVTEEELVRIGWPKRVNIRARGILAVANNLQSFDFADGSEINDINCMKREYHHIFPDSLIKEGNEHLENNMESDLALNCAFITGKTNRNIGRKDPLKYLKERYSWASESIIKQRLESHLIPIEGLRVGDYTAVEGEDKSLKIKKDYEEFIQMRARLVVKAINKLVKGERINYSELS